MKLPVFKAVETTFAFVFGHYIDILKIVLIPIAVLSGLGYWLNAKFLPLQIQMQQIDPATDPMGQFRAMSPMLPWFGVLFVAALIFYPMLYAGLLRFVIRGQKPSVVYLNFAGDEFRLLLSFIILILLWIAITIGAGLAIGIPAGVLGAMSRNMPWLGLVIAGICIFVVIFVIWIMLRLSLVFPANIGTKKLGIGESWSATKGAAWALFFYWLLWAVLLCVVSGAFFAFVMPDYFSGLAEMMKNVQTHAGDQVAFRHAMRDWQIHNLEAMQTKLPLMSAAGLLYGIVVSPLLIVASGVAYRLLTKGEAEDEAA